MDLWVEKEEASTLLFKVPKSIAPASCPWWVAQSNGTVPTSPASTKRGALAGYFERDFMKLAILSLCLLLLTNPAFARLTRSGGSGNFGSAAVQASDLFGCAAINLETGRSKVLNGALDTFPEGTTVNLVDIKTESSDLMTIALYAWDGVNATLIKTNKFDLRGSLEVGVTGNETRVTCTLIRDLKNL